MKIYAHIEKVSLATSSTGSKDKKRKITFELFPQEKLKVFKDYLMALDEVNDLIVELDVVAVDPASYNEIK